MLRVLFIWPPYVEYIYSLQKRFTDFGETATYVANQADFSVTVMDGTAHMLFQWDFISAYAEEYDFLVICTDTHNALHAVRAAHQCKRITRHTRIVAFGQAAAYVPDFLLSEGFDAVVVTPMYEDTLVRYMRSCSHDGCDKPVVGVATRHNGQVTIVPDDRPLSISHVPFPNLALLPFEQYKHISGRDQICFSVSRGCPYSCRFCRVPVSQGSHLANKSVDEIIAYLPNVVDRAASLKFIAPTFTADREWSLNLSSRISKAGIRCKWIVTTRLELLDEELLMEMSRAGCIAIAFGLETLYPETQRQVDKHLPEALVLEKVGLMRYHGIIPKAFVMLGIPGQTRQEIEDLYAFLQRHQIEIRPKEYYPYERLRESADHQATLARVARDGVYKSPIAGVTPVEFVRWLNTRTAVR